MTKKVAYVDPNNPGIVRFYGADEFDGVLAGTRAQMIVDALNGTQPEAMPTWERLLPHWELALTTYKTEREKGRAESFAMREALLQVADALDSRRPQL